jgi:hypothetical protein
MDDFAFPLENVIFDTRKIQTPSPIDINLRIVDYAGDNSELFKFA